jgi:hypothetical protein
MTPNQAAQRALWVLLGVLVWAVWDAWRKGWL